MSVKIHEFLKYANSEQRNLLFEIKDCVKEEENLKEEFLSLDDIMSPLRQELDKKLSLCRREIKAYLSYAVNEYGMGNLEIIEKLTKKYNP